MKIPIFFFEKWQTKNSVTSIKVFTMIRHTLIVSFVIYKFIIQWLIVINSYFAISFYVENYNNLLTWCDGYTGKYSPEGLLYSLRLPGLCLRTECLYYLLTNWLAYLYGRIQSPRPDVMPDRREGITRAAGFVFACIDTQTS